jgi:glyoxylase-like metal-dependent hydrolase (beta-lactamase superfamily II)
VPQPPRVEPDAGLVEVADRVWVARSSSRGANVTVVAGSSGLVLVDALGSAAAGRRLLTDVRRLGRGDLVAVVLTHAHEAHTGGVGGVLAGLREDGVTVGAVTGGTATGGAVPVVVHEAVADRVGVPGRRTLSSVSAIDLGDRVVEVVHPGRGHTDGDVVVRVPDAEVVVVGDLAAGDAAPSYGPECWPLEWPASLDLVLQLLGGGTSGSGPGTGLAVPGHGPLLDRDAVQQQRDGIATVAEAIRELAGRGVAEGLALSRGQAEGSWPWPAERLTEAVRRGYAQLPRSAKRLPLA